MEPVCLKESVLLRGTSAAPDANDRQSPKRGLLSQHAWYRTCHRFPPSKAVEDASSRPCLGLKKTWQMGPTQATRLGVIWIKGELF